MRIIAVALRYGILEHEILRLISILLGRQEYGSAQLRAVEKAQNQTSNYLT